MADIQKGYTFTNGETVTPAKLHALVDDATVADDSITTAKIANSAITSAKIADGAIVNADINVSAAIADTKLATISTTGKVANSATTATNVNTGNAIVARDASGNFSAGSITAALSGNATSATNLAGGSAGTVPYQSAAGTTVMLAAGNSGQVLRSNGAAAPSWLTLSASATTDTTNAANISSGTLPIARIPTGTTSSTLCIGNDSRLSDARTPTSHTHSISDTTGLQTALDSKAATSHTHSAATTTDAGFLSATDKAKLDAATSTLSANTIVVRDVNGNFQANSITASSATSSFGSVRVGRGSGTDFTNTAVGGNAPLSSITTGANNTAIGYDSQNRTTTGTRNVSVGQESLFNNTSGTKNIAIGTVACNKNSTGNQNVAVGDAALFTNVSTSGNTAIGDSALNSHTTGNNNTALGNLAGAFINNYSNSTCLGHNSAVTGSNQVRIGNSSVTAVVSQVGNWSDARDKTDIRNTILGLSFIQKLRPVDFKWDCREDYRPAPPAENASEQEKTAYLESVKLANITHDGTHKRTRYHHGLIAQEINSLIEQTGVDFGGFQDHTIAGGDAVMTISYIELIAPLIKAVQELVARVEALETAQQ